MPWGDRTGPMGFGPMTGRGTGYCAGYPVPGYANPWVPRWRRGRGRGFGGRVWGFSGWGRGRGLRWGYAPYGYRPYSSYPPF